MPAPVRFLNAIQLFDSATPVSDPEVTSTINGLFTATFTTNGTNARVFHPFFPLVGGSITYDRGTVREYALVDALDQTTVAVFSDDSNGRDIFLHTAFGSNTSASVTISNSAGDQVRPEIVRLSSTVYAVAYQNVATSAIEMRTWNSITGALSTVAIVANNVTQSAFDLGLTALSNGTFVVTWRSSGPTEAKFAIYNSLGGLIKAATVIAPGGATGAHDVVALPDGGFAMVAYATGGESKVVFSNANGSVLSAPVTIPIGDYTSITALQDGRVMVVGGTGTISGQIVRRDGTLDGDAFVVATGGLSGAGGAASITTQADGLVVVTWIDSADDVFYTIYDPREAGITLAGSALSDSYYGSAFNDVISLGLGDDGVYAGSGDDQIFGGDGNDFVDGEGGQDFAGGGFGNDSLTGGAGSDTLDGGPGADSLTGGSEFDFASYASAAASVWADLLVPSGNFGDAKGDIYTGIEGLIGSNFRDFLLAGNDASYIDGLGDNDVIYGRAGTDTLLGGAGDDEIFGGAGADGLNGGDGFDFAGYLDAASGVMARLDAPGLNTADAAGDTYVSIEGLIGSNFGDFLVGDAGVNYITAQGGDDYLAGVSGDDTLRGDDGADNIWGGEGADSLDGGAGYDIARYDYAASGVVARLDGGANAGEATGDTYTDIEALYGSAFGDILIGGSGGEVLAGLDGSDLLYGLAGNDMLLGGGGIDAFAFNTAGFGTDTVLDFATTAAAGAAHDYVDFRGIPGLASFTITQSGADTLVTTNLGVVRLQGITAATLVAGDFLF
jgi:Ca2+-binding RTX toxin-like protein